MLLPVMTKLAASILMSAATLTNPTTPNNLSFQTSAFVTVDHRIQMAVSKTTDFPVSVLLRNAKKQVVFQQNISKKETKYAAKLNVDELPDGQYELEVKSEEGSIRKELTVSTQPVQQINRVVSLQ